MSLFQDAKRELRARQQQDHDQQPDTDPDRAGASSTPIDARQATVTVDGVEIPIEEPETAQSGDSTWLSGAGKHGRPRGRDALQARKISQTAAMETITNGIVDQLLGGELTAESDGQLEGADAALWDVLRDVLEGPHPMGNDLDDLITAAVADLIGPGNAYWQLLSSEDGAVPVVAMLPLDALTIRHNLKRNGFVPEDEPAYWQAKSAFTAEGMAAFGDVSPTPLEDEDLAVMHYPRGKRAYQVYPKSPSLQVLEWLEILVNSTTHHNRFYDDNEIPPGFIQVLNATDRTVQDLEDKIQQAQGDPRSVEVIGGEGQAMWVEMGGTAVNLDVIQEQQWFFELCLGALGLGKAEVGLIEDVNRANGEVEATRVYKRVTGPFAKQIENALLNVCRQFEQFDGQFTPKLRFTDPREEHARQERFRKQYQSGLRTYNDFQQAIGRNPDELDTEVEIVPGMTIDYGDKPKPIVESLMIAKRMAALNDTDSDGGDGEEAANEQIAKAFELTDDEVAELQQAPGGTREHNGADG